MEIASAKVPVRQSSEQDVSPHELAQSLGSQKIANECEDYRNGKEKFTVVENV